MDNLSNTKDANRCESGDHAFEHEYTDGAHVFTCTCCGYSVLPSKRRAKRGSQAV